MTYIKRIKITLNTEEFAGFLGMWQFELLSNKAQYEESWHFLYSNLYMHQIEGIISKLKACKR